MVMALKLIKSTAFLCFNPTCFNLDNQIIIANRLGKFLTLSCRENCLLNIYIHALNFTFFNLEFFFFFLIYKMLPDFLHDFLHELAMSKINTYNKIL